MRFGGTAPRTAGRADNSTAIATTAYVKAQAYATLASPALTGTPTAPTAAADTNTTQLATTAYVLGQGSSTSPAMAGTAAAGTALKWARADHVHPTDTSRAPLASPAFTGTVLLGTSTPLTNAYAISTAITPALQIQGNTANAAALSITRNTSAAANLLLQRGVTGTPVTDTEAVGQISFNGFDGTNYFNAALIRGVVDGTPGTGSMPGRLSFQTTPTGSTTPVERLRLDPAGQILAASLGTAALPVWSFTGDSNTGIYSPGADQVAISTNASERLRITSTGLVGIGTSTPQNLLHLRSDVSGAATQLYLMNRTSGASVESRIAFTTSANDLADNRHAYIGAVTTGAGQNGNSFVIATNPNGQAAQTRVFVSSTGNVGIGTTSPGYLLDVSGSARLGAATGDVTLEVGAGASANRNALIDFVGDTTYTDYGLRIIRANGGANADSKIQHRGTGLLIIEAQDAASTVFFNGGNERARIDSSGRLLVGTSSDSGGALLQVNSNRIRIATAKTPASATDTGTAGEICWDASYIYVCTATNTWKRTAIATW